MKYSEIRENYQNHNYGLIIDRYACSISPIITKLLLKTNLIPNQATILMMLSGIVGAVMFAVPNIWSKIVGIVFIHLWYIIDCSDGELARIKKQFSKFGTEIDYTAHILNHPLFNMAFLISMIQLNKYDIVFLMSIFMVIIVVNLIFRNLVMFKNEYRKRMSEQIEKSKNGSDELVQKTNYIVKFFDNMTVYPNYALIFPIVYVVDYFSGLELSIYYTLIFMLISGLIVSIQLVNWVRRITHI